MKQFLRAGAAASAFAHLLGFSATATAAAEDDDDNRQDAARAEEGEEDEDDSPKDGKKAKKLKKADGDDDDAAEGDDDQREDAARAEDGDGDDDDKDKDSAAAGRKAERSRWAKVLRSPAAGHGRLPAACEMLANTGMSASAVIATLTAFPAAPQGSRLGDRMAGVRSPSVGVDGGAPPAGSSAKGMAAQIVAAGKKRRGES